MKKVSVIVVVVVVMFVVGFVFVVDFNGYFCVGIGISGNGNVD